MANIFFFKSQQASVCYIPGREFLGKSRNFLWRDLSLRGKGVQVEMAWLLECSQSEAEVSVHTHIYWGSPQMCISVSCERHLILGTVGSKEIR